MIADAKHSLAIEFVLLPVVPDESRNPLPLEAAYAIYDAGVGLSPFGSANLSRAG